MFKVLNEKEGRKFDEIKYSSFSEEENKNFLKSIDFTEFFNEVNKALNYNYVYKKDNMTYDKYDGYIIESENVASKCGPLSSIFDDVHVRIEIDLNSDLVQRVFTRAKLCYDNREESVNLIGSYRRGKWNFKKKGEY